MESVNFMVSFLIYVGFLKTIPTLVPAREFPLTPLVITYVGYEDTFTTQCLIDNVLLRKKVRTKAHCALLCNRNQACRSFNYYLSRLCQLNSADVFAVTNVQTSFERDRLCTYAGMKANEEPKCFEKGVQANIFDDVNTGRCRINKKRIDGEWASWEKELIIDNSTEYLKMGSRQATEVFAHPEITREQKVFEWFRWIKQEMHFFEAKNYCEQIGGKMFSNVDGTESQLEFFGEKLDNASHWLGIFTDDHVVWKSVDGIQIDDSLLIWNPGQPNNMDNNQFYVVNYPPIYLEDMADNRYWFLCDMKNYAE